jgi:hypothetical protein
MSSAAELKSALTEALACGKDLRVNLEKITELGVTTLQLLWAAERQAKATGLGVALDGHMPDVVSAVLGEAGFENFPIPVGSREG